MARKLKHNEILSVWQGNWNTIKLYQYGKELKNGENLSVWQEN